MLLLQYFQNNHTHFDHTYFATHPPSDSGEGPGGESNGDGDISDNNEKQVRNMMRCPYISLYAVTFDFLSYEEVFNYVHLFYFLFLFTNVI